MDVIKNKIMETVITEVKKIQIGYTDIFLENFELGQGKITISNFDRDYNFSYYWGAMGKQSLEQFIAGTNSSYFVGKLLHPSHEDDFCARKTFKKLRAFIKEELLPWYKHLEFQKSMREELKDFQKSVYDARDFVDKFSGIFENFDFYLIKDKYERKEVEQLFCSIEEPWDFLETKPSSQRLFLEELHRDLKSILNKKA